MWRLKRLNPSESLCYMCKRIQMSFTSMSRKCAISSIFLPPLSPFLPSWSHLFPVTSSRRLKIEHVLLSKERCEPHRESDEYMNVHACLGVQCVHAHKWAASCHDGFTSSFFTRSVVECAVAQRVEWLRAEIRQEESEVERWEPQGELIFSPHISASSCGSQARLLIKTLSAMGFFIKSRLCVVIYSIYLFLFWHTVYRTSVGRQDSVCRLQVLWSSRDGLSSSDGKMYRAKLPCCIGSATIFALHW